MVVAVSLSSAQRAQSEALPLPLPLPLLVAAASKGLSSAAPAPAAAQLQGGLARLRPGAAGAPGGGVLQQLHERVAPAGSPCDADEKDTALLALASLLLLVATAARSGAHSVHPLEAARASARLARNRAVIRTSPSTSSATARPLAGSLEETAETARLASDRVVVSPGSARTASNTS